MNIKKKLPFYYAFYLSTLGVSLAVTFVMGVFISMTNGAIGMGGDWRNVLIKICLFYPVIGLAADFLNKETVRKDEYYFYYNAACSKWELWVVAFIQASLVSFILFSIAGIWL